MSLKKKLFLALSIATLVFFISVGSLIFYYYKHPSAIKSILERSLSHTTSMAVTIKAISYSFTPITIQATGIEVESTEDSGRFHLQIPELMAKLSLEGTFGHRRLIVKYLKILGASLRVRDSLPNIPQPTSSTSFLSQVLKRVVAVIFFEEISVQVVDVAGGDISVQYNDQRIEVSSLQATLDADYRAEVSGSAQITWPSHGMSFSLPHLQLTTDGPVTLTNSQVDCLLIAKQALFESPRARASDMAVKAKLSYQPNRKEMNFEWLYLDIGALSFNRESAWESYPGHLHLAMAGDLDQEQARMNSSMDHLTREGAAGLVGKLQVHFGPQVSVTLGLIKGYVVPQKFLPFVPGTVSERLSLLGTVAFQGKIEGVKQGKIWNWDCDLQAHLAENLLSYTDTDIEIKGAITGRIGAKGLLPSVRISTSLTANMTSLSMPLAKLGRFQGHLSLSGTYPLFAVDNLNADISSASITVGGSPISVQNIEVSMQQGRLDVGKRSIVLPEIWVDSSLVRNLLLSLDAQDGHIDMTLQGERTQLLESAIALNLIPAGWQLGGMDSINLRAELDNGGDLSFTARLQARDIHFESENGSSIGEKIAFKAAVNGKARLIDASIIASGSLEVDGGEVLHDRFYMDLGRNAFFSSGEARYDLGGESVELKNLTIGLKDLLTLHLPRALIRPRKDYLVSLALALPETPLEPMVRQFIVEPFQGQTPALATLNVSGTVSAELNLTHAPEQWTVMGHLKWQDGTLSLSDVSLRRIYLDLPVWSRSGIGTVDEEPITGSLAAESVHIPFVLEHSIKARLDAVPNHLSVKSSTILSVSEGRLRIGPVSVKDLPAAPPRLETSLTMDGIDVTPFLNRIWKQPPESSLTGELDPVILEQGTITTTGKVAARAFGGEIIFSDFGVTGLFTPAPLVKLNVQVNDVSLEQLTSGTSFGKVEGVLRGHIKDLQIANGQPQSFDLLLETVKTRGIHQKISVRAVDNIARIGGAQSPFMGLAGFYLTFFEQFPYRKIGVHATLKNDIFRINGITEEGGKEYLVRRGALWGVDIVNQSPDNRISFKDMLNRIKRINTGSTGPVVK